MTSATITMVTTTTAPTTAATITTWIFLLQVNLGEEMEIFTNGRFPATRHRVVVPEEEVTRRRHRQSFPFFVHVDDATLVQPLNSEEPRCERYRPVNSRAHFDALTKAAYS